MNTGLRFGVTAAAAAALFGGGQFTSPAVRADDEQHNVTYIVKMDGSAPGSVATIMISDTQTQSADLDLWPGQESEAHAVLTDPTKAGMQVRLRWPNSTTVHCEIDVDDIVAVKSSRFINTWRDNGDPSNGVLQCGAPLSGRA
jgi:hypothetical protein